MLHFKCSLSCLGHVMSLWGARLGPGSWVTGKGSFGVTGRLSILLETWLTRS